MSCIPQSQFVSEGIGMSALVSRQAGRLALLVTTMSLLVVSFGTSAAQAKGYVGGAGSEHEHWIESCKLHPTAPIC